MKVLYIGGVGPFGGASRSLYEAVSALPAGAVEPYFLMPRGTALEFYRRVAVDIIAVRGIARFDHTRASFYRGKRWLVTLREAFHALPTLAGLRRARSRWPQIDIVHVNEFTEIIPGIIAKRLFGAKLVVHVRSLVHTDISQRRTRWLHRMLKRYADAVIAIDDTVRATLPTGLPIDVIHNSFAVIPARQTEAPALTQLDRLRPGALIVGFVGNLLRCKGVVELVEAAALVRQAGANVQFIIVGGATAKARGVAARLARQIGLAQNSHEQVTKLIAQHDLNDDVLLLGPMEEIQRVYSRMDVLAFPSYFDAPGRPVFEAAFFGVPSIVAVRNPTPDTLVDGETGIAITEPSPKEIAAAILHFVAHRDEVRRLGESARSLANRNFLPETNSHQLLAVYRRLMAHTKSNAFIGRPLPGPNQTSL